MAYGKRSPNTMITSHNNLYLHKTHAYQNWQVDGWWHWTSTHKVTWCFDHVIIYSFMIKEKRYISNSQVLCTPNFTVWWLMIWGHHSKNHINLSKKFSLFIDFFHPRNVPLFLHRTTIRLLLLVRELESLILTFLKLYVTLHKIHGSLW